MKATAFPAYAKIRSTISNFIQRTLPMNDPIDDMSNYLWNSFYFNRDDRRILIPKRNRALGWTFNFARTESYLILFIFLLSLAFI